jgi:hypothetical protein
MGNTTTPRSLLHEQLRRRLERLYQAAPGCWARAREKQLFPDVNTTELAARVEANIRAAAAVVVEDPHDRYAVLASPIVAERWPLEVGATWGDGDAHTIASLVMLEEFARAEGGITPPEIEAEAIAAYAVASALSRAGTPEAAVMSEALTEGAYALDRGFQLYPSGPSSRWYNQHAGPLLDNALLQWHPTGCAVLIVALHEVRPFTLAALRVLLARKSSMDDPVCLEARIRAVHAALTSSDLSALREAETVLRRPGRGRQASSGAEAYRAMSKRLEGPFLSAPCADRDGAKRMAEHLLPYLIEHRSEPWTEGLELGDDPGVTTVTIAARVSARIVRKGPIGTPADFIRAPRKNGQPDRVASLLQRSRKPFWRATAAAAQAPGDKTTNADLPAQGGPSGNMKRILKEALIPHSGPALEG